MLTSFEIHRFRTFKHLSLPRLTRVNLFVGRNNVGKTMLLEALRLYGHGSPLCGLWNLLAEREEMQPGQIGGNGDVHPQVQVEALFHNNHPGSFGEPIRLGPIDEPPRALTIAVEMMVTNGAKTPYLHVYRGPASTSIPVANLGQYQLTRPSDGFRGSPAFIGPKGLRSRDVGIIWDDIALKAAEERVIECLRIISPVERVTLVDNPLRPGERTVKARLTGDEEPVALMRLGDGMMRVFELALAMQYALERSNKVWVAPYGLEDDTDAWVSAPMLLVDEVENGIHFSALPDVWRFIFHAAQRDGVQVFATTHSWDCIEAFQRAAAGQPEGSAALFRLERKGDEHRAVLFEQSELAVVTKHHVEVR